MARRHKRVSVFVVLLVLLTSASATALDKSKAAIASGQRAAKALEAGDHGTAARLYLEAFRMAPEQTDFLYAAAREEMAVGDVQAAQQLFQQYLGLPGTAPERVLRAKAYLGQIVANAKSREGDSARQRGDGALAASLYREAYAQDPTRPTFLLQAGRAAQDSGQKTLAVECLKLFLEKASPQDTDRPEATNRLNSLTVATKPSPAGATPPPPLVAPVAPVQTGHSPPPAIADVAADSHTPAERGTAPKWPAYATLGVGIGLVGTAAVLGVLAAKQGSDVDAACGAKDAAGVCIAPTQPQSWAHEQTASANAKSVAAWVTGGVGVAALGAGIWLWLAGPKSVAVSPTADGFAVLGSF